jgi:predicted acylesterase/phospholipase RssA
MAGGGSRGAFEAGALWGMYYAKNAGEDFDYDVLSGVSAGSINSFALSLFAKNDTEHAINVISDTWASLA